MSRPFIDHAARRGRRTGASTPRPLGRTLALGLVPIAAVGHAASGQEGSPAVPFEARVESVLPAGTIAGLGVRIWRFTSTLEPGEAIAVARRHWESMSHERPVEATAGAWRTLSRRTGDSIWTLQVVASAGGSKGLMSVWEPGDGSAGELAEIRALVPDGMTVATVMSGSDPVARSATLIARGTTSALHVWRLLGERMRSRGFAPLASPHESRLSQRANGGIFRARDREAAATVEERGQACWLVIHLRMEFTR
jgi:hypothetical protein